MTRSRKRIGFVCFFLMCLPVLASAQPSIIGVNPNSSIRGATVGVQITGSETIFMQDSEVTSIVWLSQGPARIDATDVVVTSATLLDATFNIPADAPLGLWNVNVEQVGGEVVTLADGFTILSACSITDLAAGAQTACDPETNTYTQIVIVTYENASLTGNLDVNGQSFPIGTSPQSVALTGLASDGAAVDVTASFTDDSSCSRAETGLFTAPASCSVAPCSITDLTAGQQTSCEPATNTYTQVITVAFDNAPASGDLVVNGQSFAIQTSPQSVTLVALTANGAPVDVTASFSANPSCSRTETGLFTAPESCSVTACSITDLAAGAQTNCDPATNTYSQVVVVTFENAPASGNLVVNGQTFSIGTSPQSVTLVGLVSNGLAVDVTASFSSEPGCSRTEAALFTAPPRCAAGGPPDCSNAVSTREILWSPNHQLINIGIRGVTDPDGGPVTVSITGVTADEPVNGQGDGDTCPDAVIHDNGTVDLRSERAGNGNGRVYTIQFTATDQAGDTCTGTAFVCVSHNAGDGTRGRGSECVRDETQYDATQCPTPVIKSDRNRVSSSEVLSRPLSTRMEGDQLAIHFASPMAGAVNLEIFDLRGHLVRRVTEAHLSAGTHAVQWDGRDSSGRSVASGIYIVRAIVPGATHTSKAVWLR